LVEEIINVISCGVITNFVLRTSDELHRGEVDIGILQNRFLTIATSKFATPFYEAFDLGVYRKGKDQPGISIGKKHSNF
jgi:3-hydroxyacyl-CoA dehydrogenase